MTFSTTGLSAIIDGELTGGAAVWKYLGSDTVSTVKGAGFFAGVGQDSRGSNARGMKIGDIVICTESTAGSVPGRTYMGAVSASTANQASTSASTGWNAAYDCTVYLSTTST